MSKAHWPGFTMALSVLFRKHYFHFIPEPARAYVSQPRHYHCLPRQDIPGPSSVASGHSTPPTAHLSLRQMHSLSHLLNYRSTFGAESDSQGISATNTVRSRIILRISILSMAIKEAQEEADVSSLVQTHPQLVAMADIDFSEILNLLFSLPDCDTAEELSPVSNAASLLRTPEDELPDFSWSPNDIAIQDPTRYIHISYVALISTDLMHVI